MKTNPDRFTLEKYAWQFWGTLTFRSPSIRQLTRKRFCAMLRASARACQVRFENLLWFLAPEVGESGSPHLHFLLGALPQSAVTLATCRLLMTLWRKKGGGISKIEIYNPRKDGLGYVTKSMGPQLPNCSGPWYARRILDGQSDSGEQKPS